MMFSIIFFQFHGWINWNFDIWIPIFFLIFTHTNIEIVNVLSSPMKCQNQAFHSFILSLPFLTINFGFLFLTVTKRSDTRSTMYRYATSCFEHCSKFGGWITYFNNSTSTEGQLPGIHRRIKCWCIQSNDSRGIVGHRPSFNTRNAQ